MKRFIPTIVLVVLCIGAFWYASTQSFFKKEEPKQESGPLLSVPSASVTGVKIKPGDLEFTKKGDQWAMVRPSPLPTDHFAVGSWLNVFTTLMHNGVVEESPADLSVFGLSNPSAEYEITLSNGSVQTVLIGSPLPIPGNYYAKLKQSPAVYKVGEQSLSSLRKETLDFMDKLPIEATYNEVSSIRIEWKGATKTLTKSDPAKTASESAWKLGDQELKGTDVGSMLDKVLLISTEKLVRPATEVKLASPELKLQLKSTKEGKESTVDYSGKVENDEVWLVKQGDAWAYSIPVEEIQGIFDAIKPPAAS